MDLTAYKDVPIVVSIDYFIEVSPPSCCYQNHIQMNRSVGEDVVRATNAPDLSELKHLGYRSQLPPVASQISCICPFSTQRPMGHWQTLSPVGIMVPVCVRSAGHRDVVLDPPVWALPVKKKNTLPRGPFRLEKTIVLACFQPLITTWERPTGICGILVFYLRRWYGPQSAGVTVALLGSRDGIVPALMLDHMSRQVWDMSNWVSSLTDHSAGTRKDKLEKGLLAMQDLPATRQRMENYQGSSSSLAFSTRKSKDASNVKSQQPQLPM